MKVVYPCCNIIWGHLSSFTQLFYQCTVFRNIIMYFIIRKLFADRSQGVGDVLAWSSRREEGVHEEGGAGGGGEAEGGGELANSSAITDGRPRTTNKTTVVWELVKFTPSIYSYVVLKARLKAWKGSLGNQVIVSKTHYVSISELLGRSSECLFLKTGFKQTISSPDVSLSRGLEEEEKYCRINTKHQFYLYQN